MEIPDVNIKPISGNAHIHIWTYCSLNPFMSIMDIPDVINIQTGSQGKIEGTDMQHTFPSGIPGNFAVMWTMHTLVTYWHVVQQTLEMKNSDAI